MAFDASSAIAEFLADPELTSLELPHMTTGQRKNVKSLLEQYPELRCESFGFGAERRLHLFKAGCAVDPQQQDLSATDNAHVLSAQLPVRNTFIQFGARVDERVVQSMPHGMFRQGVQAELRAAQADKVDKAPVMADKTDCSIPTTPASEPEAEPMACPPIAQCMPLSIGALVVVEGLTKLPAFNGLSAVVQGFDELSGRYSIMLVSANGGCQQAKVKEENLRFLMPCP